MGAFNKRQNLVVQEIGGELVVYDPHNHKVHHLNQTAALVWKNADGKKTMRELARIVQNKLQAPVDEQLVALAWKRLEKAGLLSPKRPRTTEATTMSRRQLLAGGLALILPAVTTLLVGSPGLADVSAKRHHRRGGYLCCQYDCITTRGAQKTVRFCKQVHGDTEACPAATTYINCQCINGSTIAGHPCDPATCNTIGTFCD